MRNVEELKTVCLGALVVVVPMAAALAKAWIQKEIAELKATQTEHDNCIKALQGENKQRIETLEAKEANRETADILKAHLKGMVEPE